MPETLSPSTLFLENLALIERVAGSLARRCGMAGDDAADFLSWVKLKLIEDDYAVLLKFRGESSIGTYLTVVLATLARDYRVQRWGRWRPSAAARRLGRVAERLEVLVRRQGFRLTEAAEALRTSGETQLTDRELSALLAQLPMREPLRPIEAGAEPLEQVASVEGADALVAEQSAVDDRRLAARALASAMESLSAEDRVLLRLRYWEGLSVADVARGLATDQKPLYRRLERLLRELRASLLSAGITPEQIRDLLGDSVERASI